jgi:exonuclease VII large subunit
MVLYSSKLTTPEPITPQIPEPITISSKPKTKRQRPNTPTPAADGVVEAEGVESEDKGAEIKDLKVKKELSEKQKAAIEKRRLKKLEDEETKARVERELEEAKKILEEKQEWLKEKRRLKREEKLKRDQMSRALVDEGIEAPAWVKGFVNSIKQEQNAVIKVVMGRYLTKRNLDERLSRKLASRLIKYGKMYDIKE